MPEDPFDKKYTWYEALFCRDLGMCEPGDSHWGWANFDPKRIVELSTYFMEHPMYSFVGREMLLESIMTSAQRRLEIGPFHAAEEAALRRVTERAIADTYDRDVVRAIWIEVEEDGSVPPLTQWLKTQFPEWKPPHSIWRLMVYEELFCKDLGLCNPAHVRWGRSNYDAKRIVEFSQYYLNHPAYAQAGREMLLEAIVASAQHRLESGPFDTLEERELKKVIEVAMADADCGEVIESFWIELEESRSQTLFAQWLRQVAPKSP